MSEHGPDRAEETTPRAPEPSEFPSLLRMLDGVFRAGGGSMGAEFPRLLTETNRANLRVVVEEGEVVSHAGVVVRDATLCGSRVRTALLGAVATAEEARGRGYATKCVRAAAERAAEDGADFMMISGDRSLYTRMGARTVGDDIELCISARAARGLACEEVEVRPFGEEHLMEAVDLYAGEDVRFIRPLEDWHSVMRSGYAWCARCTFLGAWEVGRLAAYAVATPPDEEGASRIVEHAGARGVLIASLSRIMERVGADRLKLHLGRHDKVLGARLAAARKVGPEVPGDSKASEDGSAECSDISWHAAPADGMVLVLDFESLMGKLRARFLEKAGEAAARELSFSEEGPRLGPDNRFRVACGPDVLRIEGRGALAEFVFGTPGCSAAGETGLAGVRRAVAASSAQEGDGGKSGPEGSCLKLWGASWPFRAALPAPALWYGINYT
jgi:predicted N-acetyltransferase YhbS